ncbi:MAG TPA: formate dehydrogenase accessory sulfurtransferase FdhD, partial [Longimicrobium sp.]
AAGMLFAEGLLSPTALDSVAYCTDTRLTRDQEFNVVTVTLADPPPRLPHAVHDTVTAAASACGVCGTDSIGEVLALTEVRGTMGTDVVEPSVLQSLPGRLREAQRVFDATGGLHAAGLFTPGGELLRLREDVGRHNALDKLVGAALLDGELPLSRGIVLASGRLSFELAQKAARAGVPVLAAVSAPSSLAVELAESVGMTLAGFVRGSRFNVYTGGGRIAAATMQTTGG